jgi:indole-3-glycerol phosphate synthase
MSAHLDQIVAATRRRVAETLRTADLRALERAAAEHTPRGFRRRLVEVGESGVAVIAELKKASPSKGLIRAEFDVAGLARELEAGGAAALSVLTDEEFFQGSLENLRVASASVRVPCLRKDFIVNEFQVLEARANRADAILLIVAALEQSELVALAATGRAHGLDVLCEAHDEAELQRAIDAGCDLVGVNARNLKTFAVDLETLFRVAKKIPRGVLAVAESGIRSGHDLSRLRAAGYGAFLIGETLMRTERPGEALRELLAASGPLTTNDQRTTTVP